MPQPVDPRAPTRRWASVRALLAFLALPGCVAFLIPLALVGGKPPAAAHSPIALALWGAGVAALLWCCREFYTVGRGTLAPWDPPTQLVVSGPYRYSRNPMYLSVLVILIGWAVGYGSVELLTYTGIVGVLFHGRVVWAEEPWAARTFGEAWGTYRSETPRWLIRWRRLAGD